VREEERRDAEKRKSWSAKKRRRSPHNNVLGKDPGKKSAYKKKRSSLN